MKVLYTFITTEAEEPEAVAQFIAGYESNGATWSGTVDILESTNLITVINNYADYVAQGYELVLYNSALTLTDPLLANLTLAKEAGLLFCIPVGSNSTTNITGFNNKYAMVTCGSGMHEYGNATGYPGFFFDENEDENPGHDILDVRQCGANHNIVYIQRRSATVLAFKILNQDTNYVYPDLTVIGLNGHGTPLYFENMGFSNIDPLPTGLQYVTYVSGDTFYIQFNTTAGTINTGTTFQNYLGALTFGSSDTSKCFIRTGSYFYQINGFGFTIDGVDDFANTPDGIRSDQTLINPVGWGDMMLVTHTLGAGSYTAGGKVYFISQSYSTAYAGGKLAYIKDTLNIEWQETISRAVTTGSEGGVYDSTSGYGYINADQAVDPLLDTPEDTGLETPTLISAVGTTASVTLIWTRVLFAENYEIYYRDELVGTVTAQITTAVVTIIKHPKGRKAYFKVRAVTSEFTGEFSNEIEYAYYYQAGILVKELV